MNDNKGKKYLRLLAVVLAICLAAGGGFFFGKNKGTDIEKKKLEKLMLFIDEFYFINFFFKF